jgi:hypothetical protein
VRLPLEAVFDALACRKPGEARKELNALDSVPGRTAGGADFILPCAIAEAYGALGDADRAMYYLEKSAELREDDGSLPGDRLLVRVDSEGFTFRRAGAKGWAARVIAS